MPKHRTTDPAWRAAAIADREAEACYNFYGDAKLSDKIWKETYQRVLKELAGKPNP